MIVRLSMYFDTEDGYNQEDYPHLTQEQIIEMMKEDFIDTVRKQWDDEEFKEALEVFEG